MKSTRSTEDLNKAKRCADLLYGSHEVLTKEMIEDVIDELPMSHVSKQDSRLTVADLLVTVGLADSKSWYEGIGLFVEAAKRLIAGGGVRMNGKVIKQPVYVIQDTDLIDSSILPIQVGKKQRKFVYINSCVSHNKRWGNWNTVHPMVVSHTMEYNPFSIPTNNPTINNL